MLSLLLGLFLSFAAIFLSACEKKTTLSKDTLTVATCADYPPYEFFREGKITGFDIELIEEIAKKLNKKIDIKDMSFESIIGALQSGRVDAAISSLNETPERKKSVDFSTEYYNDGERTLVCFDYLPITDISGLAGKTVGVQLGSTHEKYAKEELFKTVADLKIISLGKVPDLIQDMKTNRVAGIIMGDVESKALVKAQKGFKIISLSGNIPGISIAFPKGSPLTEQVNTIISDLSANGFLQALMEKWMKS